MILTPRREVVTPHPDVAAGRYRQAEFAADLADVLAGRGRSRIYGLNEFNTRTLAGEGMGHLPITVVHCAVGMGCSAVVEADIGRKGAFE
jgi:uncharacterized protein